MASRYKTMSASEKHARVVAPRVAKGKRVSVAKSALGGVSAKATAARGDTRRAVSTRTK